jgi:predicted transcriptional regulator
MPCVKPDGTLEPLAQAILRALRTPRTAEGVSEYLRLPLYRVRSTVRELVEAGLAAETKGQYALTPDGEERVRQLI